MNDQKVIAEVSTTLNIRQLVSPGVSEDLGLLYAKQRADREFDRYFPKIYPYITKIEAEIVPEFATGVGTKGYMIRVHVTCPLEVVQALHKDGGVHVDLSQEQITYRYKNEEKTHQDSKEAL